MEVVVVSLDPVGVDRPLGRLPAHDFDRHTEAPEVVLVPLERAAERDLVVGITLYLPLDLGSSETTLGLEQRREQRHLAFELVDQGVQDTAESGTPVPGTQSIGPGWHSARL